MSENKLQNFERFISYSNDRLTCNKFDANGNLIILGDDLSVYGVNKNYSYDSGKSTNLETKVEAANPNFEDDPPGGRFGDTRYTDSVGIIPDDLCHYTWIPSNPEYPQQVLAPGLAPYDYVAPANQISSWDRTPYKNDGFQEYLKIFHWEFMFNEDGFKQGNVIDYIDKYVVDLNLLFNPLVRILKLAVPLSEKNTAVEREKLLRMDSALKGFIPSKIILVVLRQYNYTTYEEEDQISETGDYVKLHLIDGDIINSFGIQPGDFAEGETPMDNTAYPEILFPDTVGATTASYSTTDTYDSGGIESYITLEYDNTVTDIEAPITTPLTYDINLYYKYSNDDITWSPEWLPFVEGYYPDRYFKFKFKIVTNKVQFRLVLTSLLAIKVYTLIP